MIFWIGFFVMFFNEGFVMMRHVSPWFARQRDKFIKKFGENIWYRFHGTLDYVWICLLYTSPSPRDVEESRMPSSA